MAATGEWDEHAIVIAPGLPGNLSDSDDGRPPYPSSTLAVMKIAASAGYPIRLATPDDVREVSHHAADVWLPILNFGLQVLAGGAGNVLADILMRVLPPRTRHPPIAHLRWNVQAPDASVHEFVFDGDPHTAIEAARLFERSLGYGDDVG